MNRSIIFLIGVRRTPQHFGFLQSNVQNEHMFTPASHDRTICLALQSRNWTCHIRGLLATMPDPHTATKRYFSHLLSPFLRR